MHWHLLALELVDGLLRVAYVTEDRSLSLDAAVVLACMRDNPDGAYLAGGLVTNGPATLLPCAAKNALDCRLRWQEAVEAAADRMSVPAASVFELSWPKPWDAAAAARITR